VFHQIRDIARTRELDRTNNDTVIMRLVQKQDKLETLLRASVA
jgi:hypothetical protein